MSDDPMTGLGTRAALFERLEAEIEEGPFSLAFIDVDDMHGFNREHGRDEGDRLLIDIAAALQLTSGDWFRFSGEEFAVVVIGPLQAAMRTIAEARRRLLELPGRAPVTVKVGIAAFESGLSVEDICVRADMARLHDKSRDRVTLYDPRVHGPYPDIL